MYRSSWIRVLIISLYTHYYMALNIVLCGHVMLNGYFKIIHTYRIIDNKTLRLITERSSSSPTAADREHLNPEFRGIYFMTRLL